MPGLLGHCWVKAKIVSQLTTTILSPLRHTPSPPAHQYEMCINGFTQPKQQQLSPLSQINRPQEAKTFERNDRLGINTTKTANRNSYQFVTGWFFFDIMDKKTSNALGKTTRRPEVICGNDSCLRSTGSSLSQSSHRNFDTPVCIELSMSTVHIASNRNPRINHTYNSCLSQIYEAVVTFK